MTTALRELNSRYVEAGTIPGAVTLLGGADAEVVTAGVASIGGAPMPDDAIMRVRSMTQVITAVAALRLVEAGRLQLDEPLVDWLPELADRPVLRAPTAILDDTVPAAKARTSSSTGTRRWASCSPRWRWEERCGRSSACTSVLTWPTMPQRDAEPGRPDRLC